MPGIIVFKRRWSLGSDDLVVPSLFLLVVHLIWLILLPLVLIREKKQWRLYCMTELMELTIGYIVIFFGCLLVEGFIAFVSTRGSILNEEPRSSIQYLLHIRLGIFLIETLWQVMGTIWLKKHYDFCPFGFPKDTILVINVCNWLVIVFSLVTVWCTYDSNGKSWAKTQRRVLKEYQDSWNRRCNILFCCLGKSDERQDSFSEIAKLFSEFFHDLDLVPSDIIAGLLLTRRNQKYERKKVLNGTDSSTLQFLSGMSVTDETRFLDLSQVEVIDYIKTLIHYLHYAIAIYGWPLYVMKNKSVGCFHLCRYFGCTNSCYSSNDNESSEIDKLNNPIIIGDNCWSGNYAAFQKTCSTHKWEMIYATYHDEVGQPPFFVIIDYDQKAVVVSVRGTLSLQDVITDLNAEADILPTNPPNPTWLGHKGMVKAAVFIKKKLIEEKILEKAFARLAHSESDQYSLVLVGHSLGAGAASILAILLKNDYPNLFCFSFSPPGGLLSLSAVEYSKSFITSVILGKDLVARLGIYQMEKLRYDLIDSIKQCNESKWKVIGSRFCCCKNDEELDFDENDFSVVDKAKPLIHSNNSSITLNSHHPLFPPGKIIHIVRSHLPKEKTTLKNKKPINILNKLQTIHQAILVDNKLYNKILISPVMIQDHMPDKLLNALEKLLTDSNVQNLKLVEKTISNCIDVLDRCSSPRSSEKTFSHRILIETSFTDHQPVEMNTLYTSNNQKSPKLSLFSSVKRKSLFDFENEDWFGKAPLASPETSNESINIATPSAYVKSNFTNCKPFTSLELIEQSPTFSMLPKIENCLTKQI